MARVLVFDDDLGWAEQMALTLSEFSALPITSPSNWDRHIAGTQWSAIVVDVQILGHAAQGPVMAARSILDFGVTAPVTVVSGIINLDAVKKEYGDVFFDYVRKDDCGDYLPDIVKSACSRDGLERHLPAMLRRIASKLQILDKRFPDGHLGSLAADMARSASAKTVDDLIGALISGDRPYLDKMGKEVLAIIRSMATEPWP